MRPIPVLHGFGLALKFYSNTHPHICLELVDVLSDDVNTNILIDRDLVES